MRLPCQCCPDSCNTVGSAVVLLWRRRNHTDTLPAIDFLQFYFQLTFTLVTQRLAISVFAKFEYFQFRFLMELIVHKHTNSYQYQSTSSLLCEKMELFLTLQALPSVCPLLFFAGCLLFCIHWHSSCTSFSFSSLFRDKILIRWYHQNFCVYVRCEDLSKIHTMFAWSKCVSFFSSVATLTCFDAGNINIVKDSSYDKRAR